MNEPLTGSDNVRVVPGTAVICKDENPPPFDGGGRGGGTLMMIA